MFSIAKGAETRDKVIISEWMRRIVTKEQVENIIWHKTILDFIHQYYDALKTSIQRGKVN